MNILLASLVLRTTTKTPFLEQVCESDSEDEVACNGCPEKCQYSFNRREIQFYQFKIGDE